MRRSDANSAGSENRKPSSSWAFFSSAGARARDAARARMAAGLTGDDSMTAYAARNIRVEPNGRVTIVGDELRAEMKKVGASSDADIELVLQRVPAQGSPVTILQNIRKALSYFAQDKARDVDKGRWARPKSDPLKRH